MPITTPSIVPITKADYLSKVASLAKARPDLDERLAELGRVLGSDEDQARLKEMAEGFLIDVDNGYVGILLIVPLGQVHAILSSETFEVGNWHYDRTAECLLVNMRRGGHEHLSGALFKLYTGSDDRTELAAERFIEDGLGWFKSSASYGRMLIGDLVRMTAQERAAFKSVAAYSPE